MFCKATRVLPCVKTQGSFEELLDRQNVLLTDHKIAIFNIFEHLLDQLVPTKVTELINEISHSYQSSKVLTSLTSVLMDLG